MTGNLVANTTNSYIFTLANSARVVLDSQTNSPNLTWTLQGPSRMVVNPRGLNSSGGINGFGPLQLPAGSYQLNVIGSDSSPYRFRLLDLASAVPLPLGTPVTNVLSPASVEVLYSFTVPTASNFYFDSLRVDNLPDTYWRLVDSYGTILFANYVSSSQGPVTLTNTETHHRKPMALIPRRPPAL
jgi:hypothetical protein